MQRQNLEKIVTKWMAGWVLLGSSVLAGAQQDSMPGMNMPMAPQPQPKQARKQDGNQQPPPLKMPPGMHGMAGHNHDLVSARQSTSDDASPAQQPASSSDQHSVQVPVLEMQEPEALDIRTGSDLPAPELLGDMLQRTPMTLEQFMLLADQANPTLVQAQRNVDRSHAQAKQAGLPPNVTVGYSGDHIRGGEYHGGEQGAFLSQEVVLGRKLELRRDVYRAEGRLNEFAVEVQRARVHNDVARAFADALAAQQTVALRDRLLQVAMDAGMNAHELNRVGQVDAAGILSAEIAVEQARIDFVDAQRTYLARYTRLAALAGQHAMEVHPLEGLFTAPPEIDTTAYVQRDVDGSPLVKQAEAGVALSRARLQDARRERVPNLIVTAGEWYSGEEVLSGKKAGWESFAQAGVQLPLWNRNQGNIAAAQAMVDRAEKDVQRTRLWTRGQAGEVAQAYEAARFSAERYRTQMIPRARRAYELQVMKYQQMAQDYPPVLAAQSMLYTLQLGYTEALAQQWRAATALENYALQDGLDAPTSAGSDATTLNLPTAAGAN